MIMILKNARFRLIFGHSFILRLKSNVAEPWPNKEKLIPEFTYAGKNIKPHTRIYMMGVTTHGALGVKNFVRPPKRKRMLSYMSRPLRLSFADEFKIENVACGYGFTIFAMKKESKVPPFFGTGISSSSQIGYHSQRKAHPLEMLIEPSAIDVPITETPSRKKVACGRAHSLIWTDTDGLFTFGNNAFGQCGRPIIENEDYSAKVTFYRVPLFNGCNVEQIECGQDTSFVLSDGVVYSCGWSADGQTGRNTYENMDFFGPLEGDLKGEKVVKISCKADCALALTEKGDVFGWGNSEYRQLGQVTDEQQVNTPKKLSLNIKDKIIDVAAGGTSCFVLTETGDVWSWGYGILGLGPNNNNVEKPQVIPNTLLGRTILSPDSKVTKIFAGVTSAAAITNDGGLYTWGRNIGGCLGLGHTKFQHFPMRVCVASRVENVSFGVDHVAIYAKSLM